MCKVSKIYLGKGVFSLIDEDDKNRLSEYTWYFNKRNYAFTMIGGKTIQMHRFIMNCEKGYVVDHIDGHRLDNRKCNLRICTNRDNAKSRLPRRCGTSKYNGVCWNTQHQKWEAKITHTPENGGKRLILHIGAYKIEKHAAMAFNIVASELRGEFAKLNKVSLTKEICEYLINTNQANRIRKKLNIELKIIKN